MSIAQDIIQINMEIAAACARAAAKRQAQQEQERRQQELNATFAAQQYRELVARMAKHLPAWMLEYVQPKPKIDYDTATEFVIVLLPDCSPLTVIYDTPCAEVDGYEVREFLRLECDDFWWVRSIGHRYDDQDEAIEAAALEGESWHAMTTEAARRNEQGLRPAPPEPAIFEIARVAADNGQADASTWALLAIAEELRRIAG